MKARLQNAHDRAYKRHDDNRDSHIEHNERFESSLHDSYAARYFERLGGNGREINRQAGEVLR
jgi:hypothetical protein